MITNTPRQASKIADWKFLLMSMYIAKGDSKGAKPL